MQNGAAEPSMAEKTPNNLMIRWMKRILLLIVIFFIPYGIYGHLLPELDIWSGGSVVWSYYGEMSSSPEKGFFLFDHPFVVIGTLILCLPGLVFLHFLDRWPAGKSAIRNGLSTVVVTVLLEQSLAAIYAFLGGPPWMPFFTSFSSALPILAFVIAPLIWWETSRISDEVALHRSDPVGVGRTHKKELEPRRVGRVMFALALLAPQQVSGILGFSGITSSFGLTIYDGTVWFYIYPFEWVLGLSLIYGLGLVFAHRVWLCSMRLAGKGTTVVVGILSLLAAFYFSYITTPIDGFGVPPPLPLLFLTGLFFVLQSGRMVLSGRSNPVGHVLEPGHEI